MFAVPGSLAPFLTSPHSAVKRLVGSFSELQVVSYHLVQRMAGATDIGLAGLISPAEARVALSEGKYVQLRGDAKTGAIESLRHRNASRQRRLV